MPLGGRDLDAEVASHLVSVVGDPHRLGDALVMHQDAVQPRAFAVTQDVGEDGQSSLVLVEAGHGRPSQVQARHQHLVVKRDVYRPAQRRVGPVGANQAVARRQIAKVPLHQLARLLRVDVACYGKAGIGRRVEALEEGMSVLHSRYVQVLVVANSGPVVGMGQGIQGLLDAQSGHTVWAVLVALPALVLYHIPLYVETPLVQSIKQEAHPVRLQPQGQLQVLHRDVLPVVGAVQIGGAVEVGPHLHQGLKIALVVVLGPLEHQVLEQVGIACLAGDLILGTDVIPDIHGHHGQGVVLVQDDVQAVGQASLLKSDGLHARLLGRILLWPSR